jgi:transitional endoplasmic reticulum ATPase
MSEAFYFDEFEKHKATGMAAFHRGEIKEARYELLKAAEYLFKLAQLSKGKLREVRFNNANDLLEMAKDLEARYKAKKRPVSKSAETGGGTEADAERKPEEFQLTQKPSLKFEDIAGLEDVKEQIRLKMIYPFTHPEKAQKYGITKGGGILLYGPPGTGKTMLGKAVAAELDAPFFLIKPSDILSKWVGESEKNIAGLFSEARKHPKAVIFIDEVESLVPARRESQSNVMQRVVPQILAELDGFEKRHESLLFLGATNEPWEIDYAMLRPGRLDEKIYIGLPDEKARRAILGLNLKTAPLAPDVNLDLFARVLDGYTGADIAYICRKVRETVFQQAVGKSVDREISPGDFEAVISKMGPSVEKKDLERFEMFRREMMK